MLWVTRRGCHVDRTACIWLIRHRIDPDAEFRFSQDLAILLLDLEPNYPAPKTSG